MSCRVIEVIIFIITSEGNVEEFSIPNFLTVYLPVTLFTKGMTHFPVNVVTLMRSPSGPSIWLGRSF